MSDLEATRDHARRMADPNPSSGIDRGPWCRRPADHQRCAEVAPRGICGCECHEWNQPPSAKERALWTQIADELDAYLAPEDEGEGLF
ncbi:MAG: hypothetical protein FWD95_01890 [Nocardioidaceae bacterium]|nr:hypothetical protein [Nocardioidaceae bacterium]